MKDLLWFLNASSFGVNVLAVAFAAASLTALIALWLFRRNRAGI